MLRYKQRGSAQPPMQGFSPWFSRLLQNRGIDTPQKAADFLSPTLDKLRDPFLMPDMDRAVTLLRQAVAERTPICVYGDYDVDGVCASSIMLELLRGLSADVRVRIPRRDEGYGLNSQAVRELYAAGIRLLVTVDCGITNHEEVRLARELGMRVIVTDHHELAETLPPADAVLNPKRAPYPFPHLCGAGVALKVCQAIGGVEEAAAHIDLAALATVADMVMLTDENRVIVYQGLLECARQRRRGLSALMKLAGAGTVLLSEDVSFRIAPRINAGGRLEDAAQCVTMLTENTEEAERIAVNLDALNSKRQAEQSKMLLEAEAQVRGWDFRTNLVLFAQGEGWNRGIIGLVAGRLCEEWHFPTIVFSSGEDGFSVGSCRSIEGVHLHAVLTECAKRYRESNGVELFEKFGGHAMAAGLTVRTERIPVLRGLMNLVIRDKCADLSCYVPVKEYDCTLPLSGVTLQTIEELNQLEPTGFGNPPPVFRAAGAQVQSMRRCGADGRHLQFSLSEGNVLQRGIFFQHGDLADEGMDTVDLLYVPTRNEFRGTVTPQLQAQAMCAASGSAPVMPEESLFRALMLELDRLQAEPTDTEPLPVLTEGRRDALLRDGRGVLFICHERNEAMALAQLGCDVQQGTVRDPRAFNTVLCAPDPEKLTDSWQHIILADGDLLPGETALIRARCPNAQLAAMKPNPRLKTLLASLVLTREQLLGIYFAAKAGTIRPEPMQTATGLSLPQLIAGLTALRQAGLVRFAPEPWLVAMQQRPKETLKGDLSPVASPIMKYLRRCAGGE